MQNKRVIDKILNVKGLLCPAPTVMTSKTLKEMEKGRTLQVITDDVTTKRSIPLLCSEEGYRLVELKEKEGLLYFIIQK